MNWGKGWALGVNKEIWRQGKVELLASEILASEHGTKHEPGSRRDLCPKCAPRKLLRPATKDGV